MQEKEIDVQKNSHAKNILQALVGIAIGGLFLFLTLWNKPLKDIFKSIGHADLFWIAMNGIILLSVYFIRAWRWQILIKNTGQNPSYTNTSYSLILGYFVNSFTPKLGEIARCTSLKKSEKIPFTQSFGSVITERAYDIIVLLLGLTVIFIIEIKRFGHLLQEIKDNLLSVIQDNILSVTGIFIILGFISSFIIGILVLKKFRIYYKVKRFVLDILRTVLQTFKTKQYTAFMLLTIAIWGLLIVMNYTCLLALPETSDYSFYLAFIILFIGGIGWALPSPGGIGTSHFFVLQVFLIFGLSENTGVSYAILSNGLTFVFTILFGLIAILFYQLLNRYKKINN